MPQQQAGPQHLRLFGSEEAGALLLFDVFVVFCFAGKNCPMCSRVGLKRAFFFCLVLGGLVYSRLSGPRPQQLSGLPAASLVN